MTRTAGRRREVDTVQSIYDAFEAGAGQDIVVLPGTYDFSSISVTDLTIYSSQHIRFVGEVNFKNVRLRTKTQADNAVYSQGASSIAWSSPNFVKTGGADWAADSTWKIFARDTWHDIASATTTTINPVKDFLGTMSGEGNYALCVPVENVFAEGFLRLYIDNSPAPLTNAGGWAGLWGFANSDLSRLHLHVTREDDTAITAFTGSWSPVVTFVSCGNSLLPGVTVSDILFQPTAEAGYFSQYSCWRVYGCSHPFLRVQNVKMDTTYGTWLLGVSLWDVVGNDFGNIVVSGLSRTQGASDDHCVGIDLDPAESCSGNIIRGYIGNLSCSSGDVRHINDYEATPGAGPRGANIIDIAED